MEFYNQWSAGTVTLQEYNDKQALYFTSNDFIINETFIDQPAKIKSIWVYKGLDFGLVLKYNRDGFLLFSLNGSYASLSKVVNDDGEYYGHVVTGTPCKVKLDSEVIIEAKCTHNTYSFYVDGYPILSTKIDDNTYYSGYSGLFSHTGNYCTKFSIVTEIPSVWKLDEVPTSKLTQQIQVENKTHTLSLYSEEGIYLSIEQDGKPLFAKNIKGDFEFTFTPNEGYLDIVLDKDLEGNFDLSFIQLEPLEFSTSYIPTRLKSQERKDSILTAPVEVGGENGSIFLWFSPYSHPREKERALLEIGNTLLSYNQEYVKVKIKDQELIVSPSNPTYEDRGLPIWGRGRIDEENQGPDDLDSFMKTNYFYYHPAGELKFDFAQDKGFKLTVMFYDVHKEYLGSIVDQTESFTTSRTLDGYYKIEVTREQHTHEEISEYTHEELEELTHAHLLGYPMVEELELEVSATDNIIEWEPEPEGAHPDAPLEEDEFVEPEFGILKNRWYPVLLTWTNNQVTLQVDETESEDMFIETPSADHISIGFSKTEEILRANALIDDLYITGSYNNQIDAFLNRDVEDPIAYFSFDGNVSNFDNTVIDLEPANKNHAPVLIEKQDGTMMQRVAFSDPVTGEYIAYAVEKVKCIDSNVFEVPFEEIDNTNFRTIALDSQNNALEVIEVIGNKIIVDLDPNQRYGEMITLIYQPKDSYTVKYSSDDTFTVVLGRHDGQPIKITYETEDYNEMRLLPNIDLNSMNNPNHTGFIYLTHEIFDVENINHTIYPREIRADGNSKSLIIIDCRDKYNNIVSDVDIVIETKFGTITQPPQGYLMEVGLEQQAGRTIYEYEPPRINASFDGYIDDPITIKAYQDNILKMSIQTTIKLFSM